MMKVNDFKKNDDFKNVKKEWSCKFKKHMDKPWSKVFEEDPQYVHWLLTEKWVDMKLKNYIRSQPFYSL